MADTEDFTSYRAPSSPPVDVAGQVERRIEDSMSLGKRLKSGFGRVRESLRLSPESRQGLLNALLGGAAAAQKIQALGPGASPLAAGLVGAATGYQVPQELAMQQEQQRQATAFNEAKLREQQLDLTPIEAISPGIVERYPELKGMPLGFVNKIAPLLSKQDQLENLAIRYGFQEKLIEKRGEQVEARKKLSEDEVQAISKSELIPADIIRHVDKDVVRQMVVSFRPAKSQANSILQTEKQVAKLQDEWEKIKDLVGPIGGRATRVLGETGRGGKRAEALAAYQRNVSAAITTIRKLFGDSGAPSNFDVERLVGAIPAASTPIGVAQNSWDTLRQLTSSGKASLIQAYPLAENIFYKTQSTQSAGVQYKKTATDPKTNQKIGLNAATGKWEVIR